jgi:hypothetical protein
MRLSTRRPPSVSTGCTLRPRTWKRRDRTRGCPPRPGATRKSVHLSWGAAGAPKSGRRRVYRRRGGDGSRL